MRTLNAGRITNNSNHATQMQHECGMNAPGNGSLPERSAQDFLHGARQGLRHGAGAHGARNINNLIQSHVARVLDCSELQSRGMNGATTRGGDSF